MLTLFTGNPRSGKTASMVDLLIDLVKERPLYVHVPSVRRAGVDPFHEHLKLPFVGIDADKWPELVPDGAVLVVDEAQDLWRPRGPSVKPSRAIMDLETHGHRGIDIFVTTQKPRLVDQAVRDQTGRHVHVRDTGWLGRWMYEWPECSENLAWKTCALKKRFTVPKRTFGVYKSANVHTKVARGKSLMPLIALGLLVGSLVLAFMVYRAISRGVEPKKPTAAPAAAPAPASVVQQAPTTRAGEAPSWPAYASHAIEPPEPYASRGLQMDGGFDLAGVGRVLYFGVIVEGVRVATVTTRDLARMGYRFTEQGPCAGVLHFGELRRMVTCGKPEPIQADRFAPLSRPAVDPAPRPVAPPPGA